MDELGAAGHLSVEPALTPVRVELVSVIPMSEIPAFAGMTEGWGAGMTEGGWPG